jgi:hypothetical protein
MGGCGSLPAGFALAALTLAGPMPHKGLLLTGFFYPALTFCLSDFRHGAGFDFALAGRPISQGGATTAHTAWHRWAWTSGKSSGFCGC